VANIGHRALLIHDINGVPSYVPTDEVILQFVGLGGHGGAIGAAGDVALVVVAASMDLPGCAQVDR
jgi:hypothetical protein